MKKLHVVNAIAALFIVMVVGTLALGIAFQTPPHSHSHEHHNHGALHGTSASGVQEYTCSMHPSFRSTDPNDRCPICGMELIPVAAGGSDDEFVRIEFSGRSLALLGLQSEPVRQGHAYHEVRLTGQIEFDERALTSISAWTGGRIERLFVNYTGAYVQANEPLVELYSPELFIAQQELIQAHRQAQGGPDFLRDSQAMTLRAARERLRLLGLTQDQVNDVIERGEARERITIRAPSAGLVVTRNITQGDYVNTGDVLLKLANENKLWALFEVFERDLVSIQVGQEIKFTLGTGRMIYSGEVISIAPRIDADRRTRTVRVALENPGQGITPGSFTRATVQLYVDDVLTIPTSAALITGQRAVVYIQMEPEGGEFEARTVELGRRLGDRYEVLRGLEAGELIVSRGAFRIDSELQLRGRPSMMAPQGNRPTGHEHHGHGPNDNGHQDHDTSSHAGHDEHEVANITFDESIVMDNLFNAYHAMWDALHSDNFRAWQAAAEQFYHEVDAVQWTPALAAVQEQVSEGKGHAHHVSGIRAARDLFFAHSQGMIALAEAGFHADTLYRMHCPMARRGQGADWLQRDDQLLNPYFGAQMLRCGDQVAALPGQGG